MVSLSIDLLLYNSYSILDINGPPRPIQTLEPGGPNNPGLISYVVRGVLYIHHIQSHKLFQSCFLVYYYILLDMRVL
jgi:hypothetical protein